MNSHVNGVALDVKSLPVVGNLILKHQKKPETGSNRLALFQIKASSSEESSGSAEVGEGFSDLKEKVGSLFPAISSWKNWEYQVLLDQFIGC